MKFLSPSYKRLLLGATVLLASAAVQADVKIVSHMTGTQMGHGMPDQTITSYYKGGLMRADVGSKSTIVDTVSGKSWILDNDAKTYSEMDFANSPMMKNMKMSATATVTPTDEHKTVAGHDTTKYSAAIHFTMSMEGMPQPMNMDMNVDLWTAADLKTPYSPKMMAQSMSQLFRGMDMSGMKSLVDEMSKIQGFPLEQDMVMASIPGMPAGMGGGSGPAVEVKVAAESVLEDDLSADLFTVPSGYKEVAPPSGPSHP